MGRVLVLLQVLTFAGVIVLIGIVGRYAYQNTESEQLRAELVKQRKIAEVRKDLMVTLSYLCDKTIKENPEQELEALRWFKTVIDDELGLTTIPEEVGQQ